MWKTLWGLIFIGVMLWSAIGAKDTVIWWLEALPSLVGALVLVVTYQVFRLTPMLYALILAHMVVLFVGAHYTYAEVPLFDWLAQALGQERNNFDKLGHFMQGLVPALIAREILLRKAIVNGQVWLNFLVVCFALALSAFYELIEWWVALLSEQAAEAFLGTQGYVWDTQSDMGFALLGAFVAVSLLSGWQDKQIRALR
jgi:Predicted membrane protein